MSEVSEVVEVVGVVLAAGAGTRLRPLTAVRPKALCTVGARPLLDLALERVAPLSSRTAVNAHHHAEQVVTAVGDRAVFISREEPHALGTAGALGQLRGWIDGAAVLLTNADAWIQPADPAGTIGAVAALAARWDGERPRLLCARTDSPSDFGNLRYLGTALLPWWSVRDLRPERSGLYEVCWRALHSAGRLDLVTTEVTVVDCGTPADYLRANMLSSGGAPVLERGALVEGEVVRSVVWAGEQVGPEERLVDAVRAAGVTLHPFATPAARPGGR